MKISRIPRHYLLCRSGADKYCKIKAWRAFRIHCDELDPVNTHQTKRFFRSQRDLRWIVRLARQMDYPTPSRIVLNNKLLGEHSRRHKRPATQSQTLRVVEQR